MYQPPTAGEMREEITIQYQSAADDSAGGGALTWANVATTPTVWAKIQPLSTMTKIRAQEVNISVTHKVTIRWRDDLGTFDSNRYRLIWNGREMRIDGIDNPDMRKRFLELTCEIGQAVQA